MPTSEAAAVGEEIAIAKNGRLRRQAGLLKGQIRMSEDFDAPWPVDIRRALEGENPIEPDPVDPGAAPPAR
ncbi:MAG: hypothetical protein U1E17_20450 [Geminicoccaceae bacterium]